MISTEQVGLPLPVTFLRFETIRLQDTYLPSVRCGGQAANFCRPASAISRSIL